MMALLWLICLDICSTAKVIMSKRRQKSWLTASTDSASIELAGLQTVIGVVNDGYGSEQKSSRWGWKVGWVQPCMYVHRLLVESPVGPVCPSCFTAQLKCLGDDSEIVAVCRRTTSHLSGKCLFR